MSGSLPLQGIPVSPEEMFYIEFFNGVSGPVEPLIMEELGPAIGGTDADRVSWAERAVFVLYYTLLAVERKPVPTDYLVDMRDNYLEALASYGLLANRWTELGGVFDEVGDAKLSQGKASWDRAVALIDALR